MDETDTCIIQCSHVLLTDESTHADKENMMKDIQQYLFMPFSITFQKFGPVAPNFHNIAFVDVISN